MYNSRGIIVHKLYLFFTLALCALPLHGMDIKKSSLLSQVMAECNNQIHYIGYLKAGTVVVTHEEEQTKKLHILYEKENTHIQHPLPANFSALTHNNTFFVGFLFDKDNRKKDIARVLLVDLIKQQQREHTLPDFKTAQLAQDYLLLQPEDRLYKINPGGGDDLSIEPAVYVPAQPICAYMPNYPPFSLLQRGNNYSFLPLKNKPIQHDDWITYPLDPGEQILSAFIQKYYRVANCSIEEKENIVVNCNIEEKENIGLISVSEDATKLYIHYPSPLLDESSPYEKLSYNTDFEVPSPKKLLVRASPSHTHFVILSAEKGILIHLENFQHNLKFFTRPDGGLDYAIADDGCLIALGS